jgi:Na+-translocating ferredoxin:NAD+ oxidoreductase RnfG subunit
LVSVAAATVLITVEEAVALAFGDAATTRETLFLTEEQISRVAEEGGGELSGAMVTRYVAMADGNRVGYAYLDTHRVRTLPETLMVVLEPGGGVRRVEVVAFREPLEYVPRDSWYGQFEGERLSDELALKRNIRPVTGATLTARATTEAVRRILAIHTVVETGDGR